MRESRMCHQVVLPEPKRALRLVYLLAATKEFAVNIRFEGMRILSCIAVISFAVASNGSVIFGNLATGVDGTAATVSSSPNNSIAVGFTMSGTFTLNSVSVDASPSASDFVVLRIFDNNPTGAGSFGAGPGSVLRSTTLAGSPVSTTDGFETYTFNLSSALELTSGNTYWAVISSSSTSFSLANRGAYSGAGATFFATRSGGSTSWFPTGIPNSEEYNLQLDAAAVPEPIHAGIAAAGFVVLVSVTRTRLMRRMLARTTSTRH